MTISFRPIADYACNTGEGPIYHSDEDRVYWVDIPAGRLFSFDRQTGVHRIVLETDAIGGATIQEDGSLLLFMAKGAIKHFKDGVLTTLIEHIPEEMNSRFNDVIADPAGRVFCGSMPSRDGTPGRLYRLDHDGTLKVLLEGIGCSNGMGYSPDLTKMYYTDTTKREIYVFDYNPVTSEISNQKLLVKTPEGEGWPDGMTVDKEGFIWSTRWDGNMVVRYSPEGNEVAHFELPVRKVSSITFGGPDYQEIFLTTAGGNQKEQDGEFAGALFAGRSDIAGRPEFRSKIQVHPR